MADGADAGDQVTGFLKQKAGPLPVGVWIIAIGGGVMLALYMRRSAAANAVPDTSSGDGSTDPTGAQGGNTYTPAGAGNLGGSGVTPIPTAPADNDEWFKRAADYLTAKGLSGAQVQYSLSQFLGGAPLSSQDRAIVDMAIAGVGNPPTAPPPAPNKPPDPPIGIPRPVPSMPKPNGPARPAVPGPPVQPHLVAQTVDKAGARVTVGVTSVRGATAYIWLVNGAQANTTSLPSVTLTRLPRRSKVTVSVIPQNLSGKGPQSKGLVVTTK